MRKKILLAFAVMSLSLSAVSAQNYGYDYDWSAGVRIGGETAGAAIKYKFDPANAIEVMLAIPWDNGFVGTVLYERHVPVIQNGFYMYYGAGGHIGDWKNRFAIGLDAVIGLEYKIPSFPMVIGLDYKPIFNIANKTRFYLADVALSAKFTF